MYLWGFLFLSGVLIGTFPVFNVYMCWFNTAVLAKVLVLGNTC